jgi:release factor glutamine methyltransferase
MSGEAKLAVARGGVAPARLWLWHATEILEKSGVASARLDAEVLLADALGTDRAGLYRDLGRPLGEADLERFFDGIRRRSRREPIQYIRGFQEFFSRPFAVDRRVFVPRPETEILVEAVLRWLEERPSSRVLDVGTGSGAIAITLALELEDTAVVGTDAASGAIEVARGNATRLGARVEFRCGDLFGPVAGERFDAVVSNPPYVPRGAIATLEPEVRDFEPRTALDGGPDGLEAIRRLVAGAPAVLEPGGLLAFEVGSGQASAAMEIAAAHGFFRTEVRPDLAGIERVVMAHLGD